MLRKFLSWVVLMATVIVSNLTVFSDASGHGNQSHLVYAANQQRWWLFNVNTKTATVVNSYVSSSNDDTSATWSAGTSSPAFPSSHALTSTNLRQLCALGLTNGTTDAAHVSVGMQASSLVGFTEHIRCTFTGSSSITWDASWNETAMSSGGGTADIQGMGLGVGSTGFIHDGSFVLGGDGNVYQRISSNVDTTATWTNGFAAITRTDTSPAVSANQYSFASLGSAAMLSVYDNGATATTCTGLRYLKYTSGTTWPTSGSAAVGNGTSSQDKNDWGLCGVDATHIFCIRRAGTNSYANSMYTGSAWISKSNPPLQNHKAGSGIFLATDGTNLWMFVLDSTGNNAVMWNKYTVGSDSWGTWTTLEAAGSTARNYISGYPLVSNNQIGVIWTAVNGSNFDLVTSALSLTAGPSLQVPWDLAHSAGHQLRMAL